MKKKLFTLLIVVVLLFVSANVFADELLKDLNEEEFAFYEETVTILNNSKASIDTGINFGGLERTISDKNLEMKEEFSHQNITSRALFDLVLDNYLIRKASFSYETDMKSNEGELNQEYNFADKNSIYKAHNDINVNEYSNVNMNVFLNNDFRSKKTSQLFFGVGYEKESRSYTSENGSFTINNNGVKSKNNYNNLEYNYESQKPYLIVKSSNAFVTMMKGALSAEARVYPRITSTNTLQVNNNEFESELEGWGLGYDLNTFYKINENLLFKVGYNYKYQNLESKNNKGANDLVDEIGPSGIDSINYDLTEKVTGSNHKVYVGLVLKF